MKGENLASTTRFLVLALSALYALGAVLGVAFVDFETTRDLVLWLAFLLGGAALMLVGQLVAPAGWSRAVLVSLGAAGGLPLFWTLIVPIAAAAVLTCNIALARRQSAPA